MVVINCFFQDVLRILKSCLSGDEAYNYAQYVSFFVLIKQFF